MTDHCSYPDCRCPIDKTTICAQGLPDKELAFCSETGDTARTDKTKRRTEVTPVLFHKIPDAVVALASTNGTYSVHDVYAYEDGRLFAKRGNGYLLLYKSGMTSLKGVRLMKLSASFEPEGDRLGYMTLPKSYKFPEVA